MRIGKGPLLIAAPLVAGLGVAALAALAAGPASAGPASARPAVSPSMPASMRKPVVAGRSVRARVATGAPAVAPVDHVTIYMFRKKSLLPGAPDGKYHDEMVPSTWSVRVGVWTEVTMINYDDGPHSITIPQLGLDEIAQGAVKTTTPFDGETHWETLNLAVPTVSTFVFRIPKAGLYAWYCKVPCDGGVAGVSYAMTPANDYGMTGFIVAA